MTEVKQWDELIRKEYVLCTPASITRIGGIPYTHGDTIFPYGTHILFFTNAIVRYARVHCADKLTGLCRLVHSWLKRTTGTMISASIRTDSSPSPLSDAYRGDDAL